MEVRELWLRVLRAAALSDSIGDMANGLNSIAEVFDLDVPSEDDDYDLDAIDTELESMGFCAPIHDARRRLKEVE